MKKTIFASETITHYEELRPKIIEQRTSPERGWAAFIRHGMLGWSLILVDNDKRKPMDEGYNLRSNIFLGSNDPIISILANMVHCVHGEVHV